MKKLLAFASTLILILLFSALPALAQEVGEEDTAVQEPVEVDTNVEADSTPQPKKKLYAILGDLAPLLAIQGGAIYCSTLSNNPRKIDDRENCFTLLIPIGFGLSAIGTLPSHFYAKTVPWKMIAFPTSKILIGGIITALEIAFTYEDESTSIYDTEDEMWESTKRGYLMWNIILATIHIIEIFDQVKSINKYNSELTEKSNNAQLYLTPTVWDDRVGMAMQINF